MDVAIHVGMFEDVYISFCDDVAKFSYSKTLCILFSIVVLTFVMALVIKIIVWLTEGPKLLEANSLSLSSQ